MPVAYQKIHGGEDESSELQSVSLLRPASMPSCAGEDCDASSLNAPCPTCSPLRQRYKLLRTCLLIAMIVTIAESAFALLAISATRKLERGTGAIDGTALQMMGLGQMPFEARIVQDDHRFVDLDPEDGTNGTQLWNGLSPGTVYVVVDNADQSLSGGSNMATEAADSGAWSATDEVFAVAAFHELHCISSLQHAMHMIRAGKDIAARLGHLSHCVEQLRSAVVCRADPTLEPLDISRPEQPFKPAKGPSGSGNVHYCRDWSSLVQTVRARGVIKSHRGWVPLGSSMD